MMRLPNAASVSNWLTSPAARRGVVFKFSWDKKDGTRVATYHRIPFIVPGFPHTQSRYGLILTSRDE